MFGNCILCNTYTQLNRLQICTPCFTVDEQLLQQARDTLRASGRMSVFELADTISVPYERVMIWLQQNRIKPNMFIHACPFCGKQLNQPFCECMTYNYIENGQPRQKFTEKFYATLRVQQLKDQYWGGKTNIKRKQKRDIWLNS